MLVWGGLLVLVEMVVLGLVRMCWNRVFLFGISSGCLLLFCLVLVIGVCCCGLFVGVCFSGVGLVVFGVLFEFSSY